jgi:polar amino acid transport system substrate-binding protein
MPNQHNEIAQVYIGRIVPGQPNLSATGSLDFVGTRLEVEKGDFMHWRGAIAIGVAILVSVPTLSGTQSLDPRVADLVQAGKVRIGVFPSFQYSKDSATGQPRGLAIGIARALATRLGLAEVVTIEHPTPPKVIECVKTGGCDFGFMLIDPIRATEVSFTPAFVRSDFTYLLPAGSPLRSATEVDRPGIRIAAVRGHASTAALERIIKQAIPVYAESYEAAVDLLRIGSADALASIREMVLQYSAQLAGSRVLGDSYQSNLAGVAVHKGNAARLEYIGEFLDDMKRSGSLQQVIDRAGLRGIEVVHPKSPN